MSYGASSVRNFRNKTLMADAIAGTSSEEVVKIAKIRQSEYNRKFPFIKEFQELKVAERYLRSEGFAKAYTNCYTLNNIHANITELNNGNYHLSFWVE